MNGSIFQRNENETRANSSTIVAGGGGLVGGLCHPYSSTPAINPLNIQMHIGGGMDVNSQKGKNMKLPVGSLSNNCKEEGMNQSMGVVLDGGKKRPNVTIRDRYNSHKDESSVTLISPIIPASGGGGVRNNVQFTEPRGLRKLFPGGEEKSNGESVPGSANSSSTSVFPYPRVTVPGFDPGEVLCQALKSLNACKTLETEKQRLHGLQKRKEKPEDKVLPYDFDLDTFVAVNSEAANHALHLIFSTIDAKETEQRFRDCWPVYEKKLEGIFRRVALDWIKQLVEANPSFFRDVRSEAIGGLLVNPGGDRFISFLRQLCRFALFTKANKMKDVVKQQVLLPPTPTSDPEVTNRQMHMLEFRVRTNTEALCEEYKTLLKNDIAFSTRLRVMDESRQKMQRINSIQSARLMSYINNYPDIFGSPTEDELKARDTAISSIQLNDVMEIEEYHDFLREKVESALKKRCEEIYKPVSLLQDVMEDYGTLWHVLEMDKSVPPVLDCNSFLQHQVSNNSGSPSLTLFVKNFLRLVDTFVSNEYLNSETSGDLLQEFESASYRFSFLEMMEAEIKKNVGDPPKQALKRMEMQRNVLKLKMDNFDWSLLSRIHENGINHLLDMTPLRVYDIHRSSGRTPSINNFLDSSSSSSSGEHQQTSIVRRRNVPLIKAKPTRKSDPGRHISSVDTTDNVFNKSSRASYSSANSSHHATPLSTQNQSGYNSFRNSSLFRESITETPTSIMSASSSMSSCRMKKSVSFGDTPTGNSGESSFSSVINVRHHRRSNRFSTAATSFDDANFLETPLRTGNRDSSSRLSLSFASSTGTPVGTLDNSTQERLNKLMESVVPNNHIRTSRSSLSPIASSEVDAADMSSENNTQSETPPKISNESMETIKSRESIDGAMLVNQSERYPIADFGDISIIEDLEEMKGIMETSYVEFFRNSDSDD